MGESCGGSGRGKGTGGGGDFFFFFFVGEGGVVCSNKILGFLASCCSWLSEKICLSKTARKQTKGIFNL